jgi:predicted RNase H-like nuclease
LQRSAGGIGVGAQAWGLRKKLLEVDALMTPSRQNVVREVHPEVSFCTMKGRTLDFGKKTLEGERERLQALIAQGFPERFMVAKLAGLRSGRHDFLDACAAMWTATRIYQGTAQRIPVTAERDSRGLDMAIWF